MIKSIFDVNSLKLIFNNINDGIQVVNKKGELIFCNRRSAVIDDINIEDTLGKHITNVYPNLTQKNSTILRVLKTGKAIIDREQDYLTYRGKRIYTLNSTYPIMKGNQLIGAVEISNNITNIKALSSQVVELQSIVHGKKNQKTQKNQIMDLYDFKDIISNDDEIIRVKNMAKKIALADINVLVYGNTGTGKELLVQAMHKRSKRSEYPFIAQNCAALPSNLLEGILFGSTKGSYTGALDRPGLFELADNGTIFLDEINSMPLELQAKLLRVLQDGYVRRVGATKVKKVNVRVFSAMNRDPEEELENNKIRRDLFYRLSTISMKLSDLKDREDDVILLTNFFIKKFNDKLYKNVKGISNEAIRILKGYDWPGNVRELENIIEGIISIIDDERITSKDLPKTIINNSKFLNKTNENEVVNDNFDLKKVLSNKEKNYILEALEKTDWNITKAAKLLNIPRQTLQYKLKIYKI